MIEDKKYVVLETRLVIKRKVYTTDEVISELKIGSGYISKALSAGCIKPLGDVKLPEQKE